MKGGRILMIHPFEPIYTKESKILILGSLPSVTSRENEFYYGHSQNRFWKVLAEILNQSLPINQSEKKAFLDQHNIALWDVIASCDIKASSDSSIKNVKVNNFTTIFNSSKITTVFTNGQKARQLYIKNCFHLYQIPVISLPSTSPANQARYPYHKLKESWQILTNYL